MGYNADINSSSLLNQAVNKLTPNLKENWSFQTVKRNLLHPTLLALNSWIQEKAEAQDRMLSTSKSKLDLSAATNIKPKTTKTSHTLLFNIYVNNMKNSIQSPLYLVQYADDTFLFVAAKDIATGVDYLQKGKKQLFDFFAIHRLNVNADQTEFIVFCKSSKNSSIKNATLKVGDCLIKQKQSVKYLGVYMDRNLNYQAEVKNICEEKSEEKWLAVSKPSIMSATSFQRKLDYFY